MQLIKFLAYKPKKSLIFDLDRTLTTLHINWDGARSKFWDEIKCFDPELADKYDVATTSATVLLNEINEKTNNLDAKMLLARIYFRMKKPLLADRYLNEIIKIDPSHEAAIEMRKQI